MLRILLPLVIIASCGGGGGGGSNPTTPTAPAPSVSLSANPTSVIIGSESTLTWSSSNASSCSASGAWSGSRATSGSESVTISAVGNTNFTLACTGDGGSRSATVSIEGYRQTDGVVVDGYISGADIFIDENSNFVADETENATTSNNEGKFTIKYADGTLISLGGTDLDSQILLDNFLITHQMNGHSDFKAITPVTSVAAFMQDASSINAALGIDASIDIFTFDPVANKGDEGINDYLYEKGNQLTVLAFALQNISNDLNASTETTQDYFKAITEEIEKEYANTQTRVDIETEAFVIKVLTNVIEAKSITLDETAKLNTVKTLSGMLPIVQVKSSEDVTTAIIRFGISTLQTDIIAIANGSATTELITSYTTDLLNYIAQDQNLDTDEIAPDINAVDDAINTSEDSEIEINVLLNDSYVTSSPFSLTSNNGSNGSTSVLNNLITYFPDLNYNGTDTFSYTINQGEKTSTASVNISIEAVNDAPSIDIATTIQVLENQTEVTTVSISDVDDDDLTLTMSGTDAGSFNISSENVLTFKEAPDYETKNTYSIILSLTDGIEVVEKNIAIQILDASDYAPVFGSTSYIVDERQKQIGAINVTDQDNDPLSIYLSGGDASFFLVNSSFRTISFIDIPIYDEKSTYSTTIYASDGTFTSSAELTVELNRVSELDINHPQAIVGTDDADNLNGRDDEYDILIGGKGDDILIGGDNRQSVGGYVIDIYQFGNSSGNDVIKDFFIQELYEGGGTTYGKTDGFLRSDRIEIIKDINGTGTNSAFDIISNSGNDSNGYAKLNLGQGNSIVLEGLSIDQIKPDYIHIIKPYSKAIQGTQERDLLLATSGNSRIEGSNEPFDTFEDAQDILISGEGNDILIGGTSDSPYGGFVVDVYKFNHGSGDDLILGYFDMDFDREGSGTYTTNPQGSGARSDKIIIPAGANNSSINSYSDLLNLSSNNEDGWSRLNLGDGNFITVHKVPLNKLKPDSFIFSYNDTYTEILGDEDNNFLQGTNEDDWIQGSEELLGRFGDGIDYIFPGGGNDILSGGVMTMGTSSSTFYTNNYFINDTGLKTIIGFSARASELYNPYTKNMLDRLFIERKGGIEYLTQLPINYDEDGFLQILPFENSVIKLHAVKEGHIDLSNIILHDKFDKYVYGTKDDDLLNGSSGNDYIDGYGEYVLSGGCAGISSGDDILYGGTGNDVLVGGDSTHFCGGYNRDIFKFSVNSGQDIIVDFTSNFENPGIVNRYRHMDVLEIEENINGLSFRTAKELLDISANNIDGFAEINLGNSNTITLHNKSIDSIDPKHFRIVPRIDSYIYGTDGDDILIGDNNNNYIKGSPDTLDRFEDGHDILDGGIGDDVLDGGEFKSPYGGYIIDIYKFDFNYGYDRIFGFSAQDIYENYGGGTTVSRYEVGIKSDKIQIPNDVVASASELINSAQNNADGWAQLSFEGTEIIINMLSKEQLKPDYFHIIPRTTNEIIGTDEIDSLIGTDGNDRIMGSSNPFDRFDDGADFIEGGKGDDVLIGGPAKSPYGGYHEDTYRFNSDFGNDYLITFFAEDVISRSGSVTNPDGDGAKQSDRLEFNSSFVSNASELISNAENNADGWAKIQLGNNSLTIFGLATEDLKPDYFHIIPNISNTIIGTDGDDTLEGTTENDYIVGSNDWLGRFDDGDDILVGGEGDDVLIGGPNLKSVGGFAIDKYVFNDNSGKDLVIGFLYEKNRNFVNDYNDIIELPYNINDSGISSFDDILAATTDNADGWALINLGAGNSITLHGVAKAQLLEQNFVFTNAP